jgi:hypothetical protein
LNIAREYLLDGTAQAVAILALYLDAQHCGRRPADSQ